MLYLYAVFHNGKQTLVAATDEQNARVVYKRSASYSNASDIRAVPVYTRTLIHEDKG